VNSTVSFDRWLPSTRGMSGDGCSYAWSGQQPISLERRMAGAAAFGETRHPRYKTLRMGPPPELDAIIAAFIELAEITEVAISRLQELYALTRLRAETPFNNELSLHMR